MSFGGFLGLGHSVSQLVEDRMAKSHYIVPIVKRELLPLWYEVWDNNGPLARQANKDASLGQTRIIKAGNKIEAATIAEAENPGHIVVRDSIVRLG
jgi:hypothetical protein